VPLLFFYDNFVKRGPLFIFLPLNSERISGGRCNYNCHLPSNLLPHYLVKSRWSTIQLYSIAVDLVQSDEKRLIMVNVREGCYFFVFLHGLIYVMCLKCLRSAHTCYDSWMPLVNGCVIVRCSMVCETLFVIT